MSINWKKDVLTIPNLLSAFRLALIPVYMTLYLRARTPADFYLAGGILALSCLTDFADGFIARKFHMTSQLGQFLDPLADKITQFTLILCLSLRHEILRPVLWLLVTKETFQCIASLLCFRRGKILAGALWAGKICTAFLFASLTLLVICPRMDPRLVTMLAGLDLAFLSCSFLFYTLTFCRPETDTHFRDVDA